MLNDGWFTASGGDVEAPTGFFGWVTNEFAELGEVFDAFSDTIEAYGQPNAADMVGSFYAFIDSDGHIRVKRCDSATEARLTHELATTVYTEWSKAA
jgi:hypothetical protein